MTDQREQGTRRARESLIDATVPNAARAADYLYGGQDNFAADRRAARAAAGSAPAIERIPEVARAFRHRAIRYLAAEAGVRQFLDIGTGLVPAGATHEIVWSIAPDARIVYTESDPMVLARVRALAGPASGGTVSAIDGDIDDVDALIAGAEPALDLDKPVAVLLLSTLAHVPATIAAARAVSSLMAAVPSGSYVAIYHLASDIDPAMPAAARHWNKTSQRPLTLRSHAQVLSLVAGLQLIPPGVVPVADWRPDAARPEAATGQTVAGADDAPPGPAAVQPVPVHGVVARRPAGPRRP